MKALAEHIPEFECTRGQGGASLWVEKPDWMDGGELSPRARDHGVLIEPATCSSRSRRDGTRTSVEASSIDVGQIEGGFGRWGRR